MSKLAFMFPGQGSFELGMGRDVAEAVTRGDGRIRAGKRGLRAGSPPAVLRRHRRGAVENRAAAACARRDEPRDRRGAPRARDRPGLRRRPFGRRVLGARLGAAMRLSDAIRLVRERGIAMAAAAEARPGSMAAILGLADEAVEALCKKIHNVWPANYNCPGQLVISGETDAVDEACSEAQREGARRAVRLKVSGAFHSPLVGLAADAASSRDRQASTSRCRRPSSSPPSRRSSRTLAVPRRCSSSSSPRRSSSRSRPAR